MNKEIIVVYQDCVLCGDRGRKRRQYLAKKGLSVRKVSVFTDEGAFLAKEAVFKHKMGSLPFYTDGKRFSYHVEPFIETSNGYKLTEEETTKSEKILKNPAKTRKSKKVKEEENDESNKKA